MGAVTDALVEEATRRSGLVWVRPDGSAREHPVWQVWHEGASYVVTGGAEQPVPVTARAVVVVRSRARQGDRLVEWVADVVAVEPGSEEWERVVPVLSAARLNAPDGEEQPRRWARESTVLRLRPTGEVLRVGDGDRAAPPLPSPATTGPGSRPGR
jgi:hypothetical protein